MSKNKSIPNEFLWMNDYENELKKKKKSYMLEEEAAKHDRDEDTLKKKQKMDGGRHKTKESKHDQKEKKGERKRSRKLPSIGHLKYKDTPKEILAVRTMTKPGVVLFRVRWGQRQNGDTPTESYVSSEDFMKYNPRFLLAFYQSKIKFRVPEREKENPPSEKKSQNQELDGGLYENLDANQVHDEIKEKLGQEAGEGGQEAGAAGQEEGVGVQAESAVCEKEKEVQQENPKYDDYSSITSPKEISSVHHAEELERQQEGDNDENMEISPEMMEEQREAAENNEWQKNRRNKCQGVEKIGNKQGEGDENEDKQEIEADNDQEHESIVQVQEMENGSKRKELEEGMNQSEAEHRSDQMDEEENMKAGKDNDTESSFKGKVDERQPETEEFHGMAEEKSHGDEIPSPASLIEKETEANGPERSVKESFRNEGEHDEVDSIEDGHSKPAIDNIGMTAEEYEEENQKKLLDSEGSEGEVIPQQPMRQQEKAEFQKETLEKEQVKDKDKRGEPKIIQSVEEVAVFEENIVNVSVKPANQSRALLEEPNNAAEQVMDLLNLSGSVLNPSHNETLE